MKLSVGKMIIECLESIIKEQEEEEVLKEEGQLAAPATDSSTHGGNLPVPPLGKIAKRKSLEEE